MIRLGLIPQERLAALPGGIFAFRGDLGLGWGIVRLARIDVEVGGEAAKDGEQWPLSDRRENRVDGVAAADDEHNDDGPECAAGED